MATGLAADASTVPPVPGGKRQPVVETLNTHDVGTSISLNAQVREDFTAETALEAVVEPLDQWGLPDVVGFDRDVRSRRGGERAGLSQPECRGCGTV